MLRLGFADLKERGRGCSKSLVESPHSVVEGEQSMRPTKPDFSKHVIARSLKSSTRDYHESNHPTNET
jgi:hypothetical protein